MAVDKQELMDYLLEIFYELTLDYHNENSYEYNQGFKKGMLKIIDAVNSYKN
jgi:hypothetical protein